MSQLQTLLSILDEDPLPARQGYAVYDVLANVPWVRESLEVYLTGHRPDLEKDVLACLCELLQAG